MNGDVQNLRLSSTIENMASTYIKSPPCVPKAVVKDYMIGVRITRFLMELMILIYPVYF